MAQFKLTVDMDNAAFSDQYDGIELSRILRMVAQKIEDNGIPWMYQNIKDINGNVVGKYAQKAE
jgi:signal transduction protein with GAF and PtsI domain